MTSDLISRAAVLAMLDMAGNPHHRDIADRIRNQPSVTPQVVANISGGVLQGASADYDVDIYTLDFDDVPEDDPHSTIELGGDRVYCGQQSAEVDPAFVRSVVEAPTMADLADRAYEGLSMADQIKAFTIESRYAEDDGGGRVDVVQAYTWEQAHSLAAIQTLQDNEWVDDRLETYTTVAGWFDDQMTVLHEWEGLDGTGCPSCSSHGGRDTGIENGTGTIHDCDACGYQWVPLGWRIDPAAPTSAEIDEKIAAFERDHVGDPQPDLEDLP